MVKKRVRNSDWLNGNCLIVRWINVYSDVKRLFDFRRGKLVNIEQAENIVLSVISEAFQGKTKITKDMQLIGGESLLDSMKLVEVCLALEDLADDYGFEFDWTSETAMSKSRGMFRNIAALAEEFANQSEA